MKALKEFDYNLWTTEENGVKKYFVGVKATGEVTEVDAEVMKVLRNEEKKMRRHIEEEGELGAPLSIDEIDEYERTIIMSNRTTIPVADIIQITGNCFDDMELF